MNEDRGGGGSLGAVTASGNTQSGSASWSSRPARPRPSLGIPSNSGQGFNFSGIGNSSSSGGNSNGVFAFGNNVGGGSGRKIPPFNITPSPMKSNNRQNAENEEEERKLAKIMERTNQIQVNGRKIPAHIDDLELLGDLGNGTCGHVVKMRHKQSGQVIAVKQMRRTGNHDETKRIFMDLDVVLKSHDCKEIVLCLGCFITDSDVWICMELMATCFDKLLKQLKQPIPEHICGKVAVATLKALHYLKEEHGVIHRDVKPSNILLDVDGRVKLCDFGISGRLVDSKAKTRSAGCAAYMAPERIDPPHPSKPDYHYDIRADVWSLGITLVEMATGHFPYKDCKTDFEVLTKVLQDDPPFLPRNGGFSHEFQCFVRDCLLKNYKDRPKYKQLLKHPFIKRYEKEEVDVGAWYRATQRRLNGSADGSQKHRRDDPLRTGDALRGGSSNEDHNVRASSTDPSAAFKPQPSPRVVRSSLASWRSPTASSTTTSTTSGPHNGIMSGTSSVSSSNYHGIRTDRNASGPQPQKSSSVLSGVVPSSNTNAVYPSAIAEQQRERERERNEISRAEREREIQQLQLQRRNSHDRRTSFDSLRDPEGRHLTPHRTLHHQYVTSKPPPAIPSPSSENPAITVTSGNTPTGTGGSTNAVGGSLGRNTPSKTSSSVMLGADSNLNITSNSKGYSNSNNYERWAANIAANANIEASLSPALARISHNNPATSSPNVLSTTTTNSIITSGMYYPHHYTGPTSTSSAYSSPYLSRSSRMHHSAISAGGGSSSAYSSPHHQSRYRNNYTSGSISGPSSLQHQGMTTSTIDTEQPRSLNVVEDSCSLSSQQRLENQINEGSSLAYTRGSPAEKMGERKSVITSSSASTVPRYGYRDSPRVTKKFEFTYPGTTSLFAPGSPGNNFGAPSSHATTSGQQFYNRLASGKLGSAVGDEGKSSGGYHSLDTVTSSAAGSGSTSLNTTLPQSHARYQHVYHHHPTTSSRRSVSTSGGGVGGSDGLHYGSSHHYTPSSVTGGTGSSSYMLPHHYNYQQHYSSQHHPHTLSDIGGSGGRQSRSDREKERHRTLLGRTSGHHSPSPRDQFVHDQQQFLNASTGAGTPKTSTNPRSPSGERPNSNVGGRSPGYMSHWKSQLSAWASNTASSNLPTISSLRLRTASNDRASVVPGRSGASTEDGAYSYMGVDSSSAGFDSRRFQPRFRSWNEKDNYPSAYSSMKR